MQKLDFKSYCSLEFELCKDANKHVLEENKETLMEKPLTEWYDFIR